MDGDSETDEDERAVELSTLIAIFPELVIDPTSLFSASIAIPVAPANGLAVQFSLVSTATPPHAIPKLPSSSGTGDDTKTNDEKTVHVHAIHYLSHLPPLLLRITLPGGYPAEQPPAFLVDSESNWLPERILQKLRDDGTTLWEDLGRGQTVFAFIDHLQQEAEDSFGLAKNEEAPIELNQDLEIVLLDFDLEAKRAKFEQETFECGICLEPKKGSVCHRLSLCSHVFCVACLQDFYNTCISEGDITGVKCLAQDCGKEILARNAHKSRSKKRRGKDERLLDPSELLQIPLEQETVQRYVRLKRKNMLESDPSVIYCPRQWCQGPARSKKYSKDGEINEANASDPEDEEKPPDCNASEGKLPPPSERLAICQDCSFAFCIVCKIGWHGEFTSCFPRRQYELTEEEEKSEEYMKKHSTACPTCSARCQKIMGCNHMICFKCNSHFCYLCSSWLQEENPYKHFNTQWTPCYMRLWELEEGDGILNDGTHEIVPRVEAAVPEIIFEDPELPDFPPRQFEPIPPQAPIAPRGVRINVRVQQGLARPHAIPPAVGRGPPVQGLQRFLQMVEDDEEDEWDSDELDDDNDGAWVIPIR